ncbi:Phospholipid/glycerol acyltransferase [Artemisia annua]|uniref:Phospholipid/glycerol acyltransferase n=1 Tax=Artemisia annua TaxID=35608 RepID=A0A2U1NJH0_ARTAN|nr:Phospholipid/glycerol acyltransferase [Artemisia annua]
MGRRIMEWAGKASHLGGIPRKTVIMCVGSFAKAVAMFLNSTCVHNQDTLLNFVRSRPLGVPLITVSNHMSTLDDPVMWGFKGFPTCNADLQRWVLAAEDICFKNTVFSYFFRLGKCIPITRGGGIYQEHMMEALDRLRDGEWLHTFPEGKVCQEDEPIRRLKWGTASLIARAPVTPIVLPIIHRGFEKAGLTLACAVSPNCTGPHFLEGSHFKFIVMPEKYMFGRRPPIPLWNNDIKIIIGEPIEFDIAKLKQTALTKSRNLSSIPNEGWPPFETLNEAAQRCLYIDISERIRVVMERLRVSGEKPKVCLEADPYQSIEEENLPIFRCVGWLSHFPIYNQMIMVCLRSLNLGICPKLNVLKIEQPTMVFHELKGYGILSEALVTGWVVKIGSQVGGKIKFMMGVYQPSVFPPNSVVYPPSPYPPQAATYPPQPYGTQAQGAECTRIMKHGCVIYPLIKECGTACLKKEDDDDDGEECHCKYYAIDGTFEAIKDDTDFYPHVSDDNLITLNTICTMFTSLQKLNAYKLLEGGMDVKTNAEKLMSHLLSYPFHDTLSSSSIGNVVMGTNGLCSSFNETHRLLRPERCV